MKQGIQITLIIAATLLIITFSGVYAFFQMAPTNTVSSNGYAEISVDPDIIGIHFNVETNGSTAKEAKDENSEIVEEVITALIKKGLERDDIETQNFNVYQDYIWNKDGREDNGFRATHTIRIEVSADKSDKIGEFIDAGVDKGALVSYVSFELSPELQNEYKSDALSEAAKDAKQKAEAIAKGLGKRIGRIVSTSSSDFNYSPWMAYESKDIAMDAGSEVQRAVTDIQPGEKQITARVSVTYKIY